ncbi:Cytochrome b561 [Dyella sp. OK004]|uniref:cytochrome b n=1 Tax=Dyella sp. OK004 TaxID=1855292 RepID=UPI0008F40900|nr:cytochrome b [Dyella sp. OK004]SFS18829.1 Cytochrome b561 [Dyella sp. OK004]
MTTSATFHPLARLLHWTMALLILAMLFIGVGMVGTVSPKHSWLLAIHRPLGLAILLLAVMRLTIRLRRRPPALPGDMPRWQCYLAHASHWLLYGLMLAMPLIGWAMQSAGGYPIMLGDAWRVPAILPENAALFAWLREAHRYLAYLFLLTILGHVGAALYHALIRRDGVFQSMALGVRDRGRVEEDTDLVEEAEATTSPPRPE